MQLKTRKNKHDYLPNGQPARSTAAARPVRKRDRDRDREEQDAGQEDSPE
jgi:hypothetical protein